MIFFLVCLLMFYIVSPEVENFFSRYSNFRARNFTCMSDRDSKNMGTQNQSARPIKTVLETSFFVLNYLNITYSFHFQRASIKNFHNEAFVV